MAIVQDVFNNAPATAYAGMVANGETSNRISRNVADVAGIPFGSPVFAGSGDRDCTVTVGTVDTFLGFTIADHGQPLVPGGIAADRHPQYRSVGIMTRGAIYVQVTGAGARRAPLFIDAATGALTTTATNNIATGGWRLDDTLAGSGIARVSTR